MRLFTSIVFLGLVIGALNEDKPTVNWDWWKHTSLYQIYPRSFKDSNSDGNGDLQGIMSKMEHFKDAGIEGVWLSPIFKSPQRDMGYDISDYYKVDSMYGNNADLAALLNKSRSLGIKVFMDFVPNHTSNESQWFIDSENNVAYAKDYYVWRNPSKIEKNGTVYPPNNWVS